MRARWSLLQALFLAGGTHAADIGGYFHEAHKRESQAECASWIAAAQKAPPPAYRWYSIAAESNHPGAHIRRDRLGRLLDAVDRDAVHREVQLQRR